MLFVTIPKRNTSHTVRCISALTTRKLSTALSVLQNFTQYKHDGLSHFQPFNPSGTTHSPSARNQIHTHARTHINTVQGLRADDDPFHFISSIRASTTVPEKTGGIQHLLLCTDSTEVLALPHESDHVHPGSVLRLLSALWLRERAE